MTREEFHSWAIRNNWEQDRWGHYHKNDLRFKIQAKSVRLERSWVSEYDGKKNYTRLRGGYFGQMSITEEDKLRGLKR